MSLYTITFDDDEESSDSPMPIPKPQQMQVRKTPQMKRPPNIVTKPTPKPASNRTTIQKMQMIITDSESYDDSEIKSIPTYGKQLLSASKEYEDEYEDEDSAPKSPKIHVKDIKTDSDYEYYSDEEVKKVDIRPRNSPPQFNQNKPQPFRRSAYQPQRNFVAQSPSQVQNEQNEIQIQPQNQNIKQTQEQNQIQNQNLNQTQPQNQDQTQMQQHHHRHRRIQQPLSLDQMKMLPQQPSQNQQDQIQLITQKSKSQDIHQNQNTDFNQANQKSEIANSTPEFHPDEIPLPPTASSIPKNNFNKPLVPYRLQRTYVHSIRGKRTHYQLFQCGQPILHTKIKQGKVDELCITEGTETHFKDGNFKAVFLCANHNTSFSLREKTSIGKELMVIRYLPGAENEPRNVCVHFNDFCGHQMDFQNRKAKLTKYNLWILDLRGRIALKSIKNCIVVDENNEEVMIVLKTEEDTLSIEVREEVSDIEAMAMGLSAFLCKK